MSAENQPWQSTKSTVYRLVPTGRYRKGEEILENEFTIQVSARSHDPDVEAAMARKLAKLLNESDVPVNPSVVQLVMP